VNQIGYNGIGARASGVKHSFRSISDNSQALVFWVLGGTHNLVTDKQVRRLFALGKVEMNLETAAAKAGMDAKDGAQVSPTGASTERIDARTAVADTRGLLSGSLERSTELTGGERWTRSENDL
jgi:hypothetical protein